MKPQPNRQRYLDALTHRTMFNLLDMNQGDKVDFWILTDEPFDQARFHRRRVVEVLGLRLAISTPEDTILMKLRWAELSGGSPDNSTTRSAFMKRNEPFSTLTI